MDGYESALFMCDCKDDSSHIDPGWHDLNCSYRMWCRRKSNEACPHCGTTEYVTNDGQRVWVPCGTPRN